MSSARASTPVNFGNSARNCSPGCAHLPVRLNSNHAAAKSRNSLESSPVPEPASATVELDFSPHSCSSSGTISGRVRRAIARIIVNARRKPARGIQVRHKLGCQSFDSFRPPAGSPDASYKCAAKIANLASRPTASSRSKFDAGSTTRRKLAWWGREVISAFTTPPESSGSEIGLQADPEICDSCSFNDVARNRMRDSTAAFRSTAQNPQPIPTPQSWGRPAGRKLPASARPSGDPSTRR